MNGRKLLLPPKVILNKNDIREVQKAILTSCRESLDSGNPYTALKCYNGKFYSLMHDGIQKFSQELNGSFVRSVSARNKIVLIAGGLTEIREGSFNAERL